MATGAALLPEFLVVSATRCAALADWPRGLEHNARDQRPRGLAAATAKAAAVAAKATRVDHTLRVSRPGIVTHMN
jgi:hypothetical protein